MNRYEKDLLDNAKKIDDILGVQPWWFCRIKSIISCKEEKALVEVIRRIDVLQTDNSVSVDALQLSNRMRQSLIYFFGYNAINGIIEHYEISNAYDKSLTDLMDEFNALVGLHKVKEFVNDLICLQKVRILRLKAGLPSDKGTLHLAFTGNPGTGKTTVARIVGRLYYKLGLLSKGHFIEASRTDLIAGYQGQTALKVKKLIERAKGGVLFIDEAYSITENDNADSYGRECLTELTKALEDYRNDLVVIVAGYTDPMKKFFYQILD